MNREELEAKAKELGISFNDETSDDDLEGLIKAEEEKIDNKKKKDPDYLAEELSRVINQRDNLKDDKRTLKNQIDKLKENQKNSVSNDEFNELKKELKELKKFKNDVDAEKQRLEEEKMDEVDKLTMRLEKSEKEKKDLRSTIENEFSSKFQKQLDDIKTTLDTKDAQLEALRTTGLESEIIKAASKYKAIEPAHIHRMLKNEFEFDSDVNKFTHFVRDKKGKIIDEKSVEDYVKEFLGAEENDYLVSSEANRDSMHTKEPHTRKTQTDIEGYNPNDPEIQEQAEKESMSVEDYIKIKKLRDAKMAKVDEEREKNS